MKWLMGLVAVIPSLFLPSLLMGGVLTVLVLGVPVIFFDYIPSKGVFFLTWAGLTLFDFVRIMLWFRRQP